MMLLFSFLALASSCAIFLKIEAFSKPSFRVTPKGTKAGGKPPSTVGVHLSSSVKDVTNH